MVSTEARRRTAALRLESARMYLTNKLGHEPENLYVATLAVTRVFVGPDHIADAKTVGRLIEVEDILRETLPYRWPLWVVGVPVLAAVVAAFCAGWLVGNN